MDVLGLGLSPDGTTVCAVSSDESLRFWRLWGGGKEEGGGEVTGMEGSRSFRLRETGCGLR